MELLIDGAEPRFYGEGEGETKSEGTATASLSPGVYEKLMRSL